MVSCGFGPVGDKSRDDQAAPFPPPPEKRQSRQIVFAFGAFCEVYRKLEMQTRISAKHGFRKKRD